MLLTIDIGNSTSKFGIFEDGNLTQKFTINSNKNDSAEKIYQQIKVHINQRPEAIIISTVVKELIEIYKNLSRTYFGIKPFFADHNFDFDFEIKYFPPDNCGSDRLVDAFAAKEKYGIPLIVCDFGTATTIDVITQDNQYIGGIIAPGPNTLGSALFEKTSKLPKVEFEKPKKTIGDTTISSIQAGIYFGYIGLVDGIIERMIRQMITKPKIISTGGFANLISKESKYVEIIEDDLMLEGLYLIGKKINGN